MCLRNFRTALETKSLFIDNYLPFSLQNLLQISFYKIEDIS